MSIFVWGNFLSLNFQGNCKQCVNEDRHLNLHTMNVRQYLMFVLIYAFPVLGKQALMKM